MGHSTASGRTRSDSAAFVPHELDIPRGVTPAQRKVLDNAKTLIDRARTNSFEDWYGMTRHITLDDSKTGRYFSAHPDRWEQHINDAKEEYEANRNGVVLIGTNGATLRNLKNRGLIEVLRDSTNTGRFASDRIKLLNY